MLVNAQVLIDELSTLSRRRILHVLKGILHRVNEHRSGLCIMLRNSGAALKVAPKHVFLEFYRLKSKSWNSHSCILNKNY